MNLPGKLVAVVDDDESVRESLPDLLRVLGYAATAFASADEFLTSGIVVNAQCLLLDVVMPGMAGPQLRQEVRRRGYSVPVVFMTALADKAALSRLLEPGGAAPCLSKPFSEQQLRAALAAAMSSA